MDKRKYKRHLSKLLQSTPKYVPGLFLCVTTLVVFVPFKPILPATELDFSWVFALNQAVAQGLVFGKDIVFTFGPYASIYTKAYHPATDHLMVWGSFYFGICYWLLLVLLARGVKLQWALAYGIFLAGFMTPPAFWDPLFYSYPLILGLITYRITLPDGHASKLNISKALAIGLAILFTPLGLLPLIKGTFLLISSPMAVLCFIMFWRNEQKSLAYSSVILPLISLILFWTLSGQHLFRLPNYFINISPIISGYTEAMAITGNVKEIILYIFASVLILYAAASNKTDPIISRLFVFLSYALFLFCAFKSGFVRHDEHAIIAGTTIIIAVLIISLITKRNMSIMIIISLITWGYIDKGHINSSTGTIYNNIENTYSNAWHGLRLRQSGTNKLKENFDNSIITIKKAFPIPPLHGTTDIYSYNQSYLLASSNKWSPRPIFQSYSVFTPSLAWLNEKHLRSDSAPDNIVFKVEPIDGRLPALEDGLSWPALINNYSVQKLDNHFVYLQKRAEINKDRPAVEFYHSEQNLGEEVILPDTNTIEGPLFAKIEISQTLLGAVRSILFKPPQLNISVKLSGGRTKNYRIIANMASAGFLISPLVENSEDFVFLTVNEKNYLKNNIVKSFTISSSDGKTVYWRKSFFAHFQKLDLLGDTDISKLNVFDKIINGTPNGMSESRSTVCDGFIDVVNGIYPVPANLTISKTLSVEGWMANSAKDGIVPDAVYVTLSDENGKRIYIKARRTPRPDVKEYYKQPGMPDPGYTAFIDVSTLSGKYTLGLSRIYKGALESCQQFILPLIINQ